MYNNVEQQESDEEFMYRDIDRITAEKYLIDRGKNEGCFLIRNSTTKKDKLVLSILDWGMGRCVVNHFVITHVEDGDFYYIIPVNQFNTLTDLVEFYQESRREEIGIQLDEPCPRKDDVEKLGTHYQDAWEIGAEKVYLSNYIEERSHYSVWKGKCILPESTRDVMIKVENSVEASREKLLHEVEILKRLNHPNILCLLFLTTTHPVMLSFTQTNEMALTDCLLDSGQTIQKFAKLNIITQISRALHHCTSQKIIHRNIRSSNVIIDDQHWSKLTGFESAQVLDENGVYIENETENSKILKSNRVRWCSPEVMEEGKYSIKSDVWAFASFCCEVFSNGGVPLSNVLTFLVQDRVKSGFRPNKPVECPTAIFQYMSTCWFDDPGERPDFDVITLFLENYIEENDDMLNKNKETKSPSKLSVRRYIKIKESSKNHKSPKRKTKKK